MQEVLDLFKQTGALLHGHFLLRSGLHSREFFQCALLLQDAPIGARVCGMLAEKLSAYDAETVISPAVGGIIVGQEVARHLGKRHIFVEKDGNGGLVLRRGFEIRPGQRFVVAAGSIVDRSGGELPDFGCPFVSLVQMNVETFAADNIPADLQGTPAIKPGSK